MAAWIENGESVEIVKRGRAFARLVPSARAKQGDIKIDWEAQARQLWRGRVFGAAEVKAMENFEREEE